MHLINNVCLSFCQYANNKIGKNIIKILINFIVTLTCSLLHNIHKINKIFHVK
jgi:hypothetical protein